MKDIKEFVKTLPGTSMPPHQKIGADPEFFLEIDGKVVETAKVLPDQAGDSHNRNEAVNDGFQGEFHVQAEQCRETLINNLGKAYKDLYKFLDTKKIGNYRVLSSSVVSLSSDDLTNLSKASMQFHCASTKSAYGEEMKTIDASKHPKRYAGGHMHFSLQGIPTPYKRPKQIIKLMDAFIGLATVISSNNPRAEAERRKMYGRAGEFRYKEKSDVLEYRVPSNYWIMSPTLMSALFHYGRLALNIAHIGFSSPLLKLLPQDQIQNAINNCDYELAEKLWCRFIVPIIKHYENVFDINFGGYAQYATPEEAFHFNPKTYQTTGPYNTGIWTYNLHNDLGMIVRMSKCGYKVATSMLEGYGLFHK